MAYYYEEPSHTFNEYLLIPRYTGVEHNPQNINLHTPLTRFSSRKKTAVYAQYSTSFGNYAVGFQ